MYPEIGKIYGNRVRIRACGICWEEDKLLMVNHIGLTEGNFWAPPGGGVNFGDTVPGTLEREIGEETGLSVSVGPFLCVCEFLKAPLHAVELFFEVFVTGGTIKTGYDPELPPGGQIISAVTFMPFDAIRRLKKEERHALFEIFDTPESLKKATGYWKI